MNIPMILSRISNERWLLKQDNLESITELLRLKNIDSISDKIESIIKNDTSNNVDLLEPQIIENTLVFPINGVLIPKASYLESLCGFVSTADLHTSFVREVDKLVNSPQVNRILLVIDSPGGAFTGLLEFANTIKETGENYEIAAFTDNIMCSGGYLLGSATGEIIATPTATLGSVGVYTKIWKENNSEQGGIWHTFQAGDKKLFGDPDEDITNEEKKFFQEGVDGIYSYFTDFVATSRNKDIQTIKETEGVSLRAMFDSDKVFVDRIVNNINELF